jgi:import inner membrane translocase subunit TIM50
MVLFGMGDAGEIFEVCQNLDPNMEMFRGTFGRESTALKDGKYIKDLSYLNRPLKEVVYIDFSDEHVDYHPENCILIPKFEGDPEDRELIDLVPFLDCKYNKKS